MALVIDSSSPAVATGASSATTSSFTPPDGALLLVAFSGNSVGGANPATPTVTDNLGAHLTYNLLDWASRPDNTSIDGQAAMWWALVGTGAPMTVTVDGSHETAAKVWVITGHDPGTPIGEHAKVGSTSANSIAQSYNATATSSQGFGVVADWSLVGNETAGSGCTMDATGNVGSQFNYGFVRRTTDDGSVGVSTSLNVSLPGTSTDLWWCFAEVLPLLVNPEALDPPPFVTMRPMGWGAPNAWRNPWFGAVDAPPQPITLKVTATQSGSTFNGMGMSVKMVTGAAATQNGASNSTQTITTPNLAITPSGTGSWVYGAILNANGTTAWTANGNSTFAIDFSDVTNGSVYGNYRSTSTTTAATPVTLGASAPTGLLTGGLAQAEILSDTGLVEDVASPPPVTVQNATAISSATFTTVPNSLLVATICSDGAAGVVTIAVDGGGLNWVEVVKVNGTGKGYAGVWIAKVPAPATNANAECATGTGSAGDAAALYPGTLLPPLIGPLVDLTGTSGSVDITDVIDGEWAYAWINLLTNQTAVTMTGWTQVLEGDESTSTHYALFRRKKVGGDTTFSFSWPTSTTGTAITASWRGGDPSTPDENSAALVHSSGTSFPTASVTPTTATRWAAMFSYVRTSTVGNKFSSFTPDGALVERFDGQPPNLGSSPWISAVEIADSNGPVTQAAHTYTATAAIAESHGATALVMLIPATASTNTNASAECATGTGAAGDASVSIAVNGDVGTGTGVAGDGTPAVGVAPPQAAGTGTADNASVALTVNADVGTGTGVANDAVASVAVNADVATGTGVANDATVSITSDTNAPAECATGTGVADNVAVSIAVNGDVGTGAGVAGDGGASVGGSANVAAGTGTADNPSITLTFTADVAAGTGTANNAVAGVSPNADVATGTGTANDATVSTLTLTQAPAECATGTGSADDASVSIAVAGDVASGTGTAGDGGASVGVPGGVATGTGTADNASITLAANAGVATGTGVANDAAVAIAVLGDQATGTGTANDATVSTLTLTQAPAECATGTGVAGDATIALAAVGDVATASGSAPDAVASIAPPAGVATGTGTANNATTLTGAEPPAQPAAGTGTAFNPTILVAVFSEAATGLGQAFLPSLVLPILPIFDLGGSLATSAADQGRLSAAGVDGGTRIGAHPEKDARSTGLDAGSVASAGHLS